MSGGQEDKIKKEGHVLQKLDVWSPWALHQKLITSDIEISLIECGPTVKEENFSTMKLFKYII